MSNAAQMLTITAQLLLRGDFLHLVWGYSWVYKTQTTRTTVMTLPLGNYKPFLKVLKDAFTARTFSPSFTSDKL